jgi:hypothetical protein
MKNFVEQLLAVPEEQEVPSRKVEKLSAPTVEGLPPAISPFLVMT